MRWRGRKQSTNVEDRRGGRRIVGPAGGFGLVGILVVVGAGLLFGVDPMTLLQALGGASSGNAQATTPTGDPTGPSGAGGPDDEMKRFVATVLADTEVTWHALFAETPDGYREPTLVLFDGSVQSACGIAGSAVGPFYCPADHKLYLDLSFFRELAQRFDAPGDFAQAYIIAHEVAHHVQTLLGVSEQVDRLRRGASETQANALSVRQELQADCYAGVWAHHADRSRGLLETGDVEEGLRAAAAIGDDRLQKQSRGHVVPDSFTHGSSAQRVGWFRRGLESGSPADCDTFADGAL